MKFVFALALAALSSGLIGCPGKTVDAPASPAEVRFESGGLAPAGAGAGSGLSDRARPALASPEWVAGIHAELLPEAPGSEWRSDLRLLNGTRLLVASSLTPEFRFPEGFALPLAQILADVPAAWRGVELVSAASAASGSPRIQWRVDLLTTAVVPKRLYVLSLALTQAPGAELPSAPAEGTALSPLPGSTWPVPPGPQRFKQRFTGVVPADATVHAAVAGLGSHARALRFSDASEEKTLWEARVVSAGGGRDRIEPFQSASGFPILHEHEYELEVEFDNPGAEPSIGSAALFLYYQLPGNDTLSYPLPPAEEGGG